MEPLRLTRQTALSGLTGILVRLITLSGLTGILLAACQRKEQPVPKFDRGSVSTIQIEMTGTYKNQVWYSLAANKVVATNAKTDWDLAFEASAEGWHIVLNGSKSMRASRMQVSDLAQITDTTGSTAIALPDMPSGNFDSTAIGDWRNKEICYIIHRGYSETGRFQGFWKLKMKSVDAQTYVFEYGDVFGKTRYEGKVTKNGTYRWNAFSFTSRQQVQIEPPKESYDLCFTQYSTVFYDPFMYYQVTGALTVPGSRVARIPSKTFAEISLSDTVVHRFSPRADAIGYDWKSFDLNTNLYTTHSEIGYIIQDSHGYFYKLHFVDFYNNKGEKGYPVMEFVRL